MSDEHFVIIGNGAAANSAADVLRAGDPDSRITLISREFFPFYYRHKLRFFMSGELEEERLVVRPPGHYRERGIRLRLGQEVTRVDLESKTLYLKHMEMVHYTRLLLCCGGWPRMPEVHYAYRQHFTIMKGLSHARKLRERLAEVDKILIVGGDLVSVRVMETLLDMGKEVLFMVDTDSFWPLTLTDEIRAEFARILNRRGAQVIEDNQITGIEESKKGYEVRTRRGERIGCGIVGAFFGLVPNVEFLYASGLDIDRGILVDECLRTSAQDVWAAGDCAQIYNPEINNYWVSVGWDNACRLGEVAARNMLGECTSAAAPGEVALDYEGVKVNTSWWRLFD